MTDHPETSGRGRVLRVIAFVLAFEALNNLFVAFTTNVLVVVVNLITAACCAAGAALVMSLSEQASRSDEEGS